TQGGIRGRGGCFGNVHLARLLKDHHEICEGAAHIGRDPDIARPPAGPRPLARRDRRSLLLGLPTGPPASLRSGRTMSFPVARCTRSEGASGPSASSE